MGHGEKRIRHVRLSKWFLRKDHNLFRKNSTSETLILEKNAAKSFAYWRQSQKLRPLRCRPPRKGLSWRGKGISIFFNFCPITMIQNVNLLYIEWLFRFLKRHTFARALARAKIYWNWSVSKKSHFFMILRNIMAYIFSSIFIQSQWFKM